MAQLEMTRQQPAIQVFYARAVGEAALTPLLHGMEEEGVPAQCTAMPPEGAAALAAQAAQISRLAVGLGIDGVNAALHFDKLPPERPLFLLPMNAGEASLRALGANAARLVKKLPFKEL